MRFHAALLASLATVALCATTRPVLAAQERPAIDVVFCIDCSGSMGPVIETAKQKVWAIVNEIAKARPAPVLRIGLLGYGDSDRQFRRFPLSDDLDEVYKNLMTFKDEGWGTEFVGMAIHLATTEMRWTPARQSLKVVYMVGNETARQGPPEMDFAKTAPAAIRAEIVVNAIYCGDVAGHETWQELARLADGQFLHIAGKGGAVIVQTPFDARLDALSKQVNTTYLAYGAAGEKKLRAQAEQDVNARQVGGLANSADRAAAKTSYQYNQNARLWDLVEASKEKDFDWSKVKNEDLPAEMRSMSLAQRKGHVAKKAAERAAVQAEIKEISVKRDAFVKEEFRKQGLSGDKAFDEAVRRSIVEQAKRRGFQF